MHKAQVVTGELLESLGFYSGAEEVGEGQVKIVKIKKLEVGRNDQLWARPVWSWQRRRSWMMTTWEESIGG